MREQLRWLQRARQCHWLSLYCLSLYWTCWRVISSLNHFWGILTQLGISFSVIDDPGGHKVADTRKESPRSTCSKQIQYGSAPTTMWTSRGIFVLLAKHNVTRFVVWLSWCLVADYIKRDRQVQQWPTGGQDTHSNSLHRVFWKFNDTTWQPWFMYAPCHCCYLNSTFW